MTQNLNTSHHDFIMEFVKKEESFQQGTVFKLVDMLVFKILGI